MPAGACDCHMHVYDRDYPLRPGWTAAVPDAPLAAYRRVQRALGLARTIVVQASAYGFDNACAEAALRALGAAARGVAAVRPDIADAELARLHAAGFRGAGGPKRAGAPQ
jgi:D-galactarolactone isomerase